MSAIAQRQTGRPIRAAGHVPAPPEEVFDFLSDLANHWRLVDRFVEVIDLDGSAGEPPDGALVRLRGPLGLRRTVSTRVTLSERPDLIVGTAELRGGTRGRVSWTIAPRGDQAVLVTLAAVVEHATPLDRMLLAIGGRLWLRRRFASGLERLAQRFAADGARYGEDPENA